MVFISLEGNISNAAEPFLQENLSLERLKIFSAGESLAKSLIKGVLISSTPLGNHAFSPNRLMRFLFAWPIDTFPLGHFTEKLRSSFNKGFLANHGVIGTSWLVTLVPFRKRARPAGQSAS